jgi:hypothetical protein
VDQETEAVAPPKEQKMAMPSDNNVNKGGGMEMAPPTQGLSSSDIELAGTLSDKFGGGYDVGHSAPFWLVDKKGLIRIGMDAESTPVDLVTNIRALLNLK